MTYYVVNLSLKDEDSGLLNGLFIAKNTEKLKDAISIYLAGFVADNIDLDDALFITGLAVNASKDTAKALMVASYANDDIIVLANQQNTDVNQITNQAKAKNIFDVVSVKVDYALEMQTLDHLTESGFFDQL